MKTEALTTYLYHTLRRRSMVLHHLDPRAIVRFVTYSMDLFYANRAVLSLQKQNVVLCILKKKKGLGQLLRRKRCNDFARLASRGKVRCRNQYRNCYVNSFIREACSSGLVGYNTQESCHFSF